MSPARRLLIAASLVLTCGSVLWPAAVSAQIHANDYPALAPDTEFPRCGQRELAESGFPDHFHAWNWEDWEPHRDQAGLPIGPGAFCEHREVLPREGLVVAEGVKKYGGIVLRHHPSYADCDMLAYLELLDWAARTVPDLLGLATDDTLEVISPDNLDQYRQMAGYGIWRLYKLEGNRCISEPYPLLQARTLDGHAAFALITEWLLDRNIEQDLPPWLRTGLAEYIGEDGVHLVNYMVQFRTEGPILLSPPLTDAILGGGPNPDANQDREIYRRACYSAFLMVWELVENQGGLEAMRDFLALAADGTDLDEAARRVYGMDLATLARQLDPVELGEPIGKSFQKRSPHKPW